MTDDADRLVTTSEAAEILEIPATLIAVWKVRNRILPVDWIRGRGRGRSIPLYRLSDLQTLAEEYYRHVRRRSDTPRPD